MDVLSPTARIGTDPDPTQAELASLRAQLAWLRAERAALWYAVSHDELTGLANRRLFFTLAPSLLRTGQPAVVIALDLNGFKPINDTFGHEAGDHVLQAVARRLAAIAEDDLVARLGGDEFIVVLTSPYRPCSGQWWRPAINALSTSIAQPISVPGHRVAVTASIGVAPVQEDLLIDELLRRADLAMYHAKANRTRFAVWGEDTGGAAEAANRLRQRRILRDRDRRGQAVTISAARILELAITAPPADRNTPGATFLNSNGPRPALSVVAQTPSTAATTASGPEAAA